MIKIKIFFDMLLGNLISRNYYIILDDGSDGDIYRHWDDCKKIYRWD
jgi:hypothetical protein